MGKRRKRKLERAKRKQRERQSRREKTQLEQSTLTPRGEYTLFTHPKNVLEIEFPSAWNQWMEDENRSVIFRPSDHKDVSLSCFIMPISLNLEDADESRKETMCKSLFSQAGAVHTQRDTLLPYFCMVAERNQEGLAGHYRIVFACDIIMSISTYCPEDETHIWAPVFERMLSTFRVPRETEGLLMKAIQRLCHKLHESDPDEEFTIGANYELKGKSRTVPLGNLMARVKRSPERWEESVDDFHEKWVGLKTNLLGSEKLEDVRGEIFPFIRPDSVGSEGSELVKSPWLANLAIAYVIRVNSGFRYIGEYDLERWSIDAEELHQLAIDNLCKLDMIAERPPSPLTPSDGPPLVMVAAGDNMEASRLLNPGLYDLFSESFKGPFIAAIPCRDSLILFSNDKSMRRGLQSVVRDDYKESDHAITDRLFLVTADGVTLAEY